MLCNALSEITADTIENKLNLKQRLWFKFALCLNMLNSLRSRFIAVFLVGLFIITVYKLIEVKQIRDAEENTEQNSNSSDNSLIFVHAVGFEKLFSKNYRFFGFFLVENFSD